jgi:hypothetical protein
MKRFVATMQELNPQGMAREVPYVESLKGYLF